jgi:hypothetical protein
MLAAVSMIGRLVMLSPRQPSAIERRLRRVDQPRILPLNTAPLSAAIGSRRALGLRGLAIAALTAAACGEGGGGAPERGSASVSGSSVAPSIASVEATGTTTATVRAPTGAAPPEAAGGARAGNYRGDYEARRGTVTLEPGVVEPSWKLDRGQSFAGKGTVEIEIEASGRARGRLVGPLGELMVRGQVEGDAIAMELVPAVDDAPPAFRGTLQASIEGDRLRGELRVVSGDGRVVRAATIEAVRR